MRPILLSAFILSFVTPTALCAQEVAPETVIANEVASLASISEADCSSLLEARKSAYGRVAKESGFLSPAFSLATEATRIRCEANRLLREASRLQGDEARLLAEANRLDQLWLGANLIAPSKFRDFPGRDRSQKKMRNDAAAVAESAEALKFAASVLDRDAERLFRIAAAELERYSDRDRKLLMLSLDSEAQNDILQRLLGVLPKGPGSS